MTWPYASGLGLRTGFGDDMLRIGSVKAFMDGALGPHTAAMFQPYEGSPDESRYPHHGRRAAVRERPPAADSGLGMTVHAIGDRANHEVLDAFEQLRAYEREKNLPVSAPSHRARADYFTRMMPRGLAAGCDRLHAAHPRHLGHAGRR